VQRPVSFPRLTSVGGEITIAVAGVARFAGLTRVDSIEIDGPAVTAVELPVLEEIDSLFFIGSVLSQQGSVLTSVDVPSLVRIGIGLQARSGTALTSLRLPQLSSIGGGLVVDAELVVLEVPLLEHAGFVSVSSSTLTTLDLPRLVSADQGISIGAGQLTTINLPVLESISDGRLSVYFANVQRLEAPLLTRIGGLSLSGPSLTSVSLPLLERAVDISLLSVSLTRFELPNLVEATQLSVVDCAQLATFDLPLLETSVGNLDILDTPLTTLNLPRLPGVGNGGFGSFGTLRIEDTALTVLSLPALRGVGTERGGSLEIINTPITRFEAPLLAAVGAAVTISNNAALSSLDLSSLTSVGEDLTITANALTRLELDELNSVGGIIRIDDNALTACSGALIVGVGDCVQ
jgi:hypothetical protein